MSRMLIISNIYRSPWISLAMKQRNLHDSELLRTSINILQNRCFVQKCEKQENDKTKDENQSSDAKGNQQSDPVQVKKASSNCQTIQKFSNSAIKKVKSPASPGANKGSGPEHD